MPASRQGIDALCGVYATINGLKLLCPDINVDELFELIIRRLDQRKKLVDALVKGTMIETVILCMQESLRYTESEHGLEIGYARPFRSEHDFGNILSFKSYLNEVLVPKKCVALVGMTGRMGHWSILRKTKRGLGFYDSGGLSRTDLSDLSLGRHTGKLNISIKETVFLTTDFQMNFSTKMGKTRRARHATQI